MKMPLWHTRGYCWRRGDFPARFLANRWSILVDLMSRILMVVVLTVVDGWWARIDDLKLRWQPTIAALFRLYGAAKNAETGRGFALYEDRDLSVVVWKLEMAGYGRSEEREGVRGERCSRLCYGENVSTVHRCRWGLWSVGSLMERSCGCDWPDLQVDRTVRMNRGGIGCDAVHRNIGTPGDVAQRDQNLDYLKGWDVFGF